MKDRKSAQLNSWQEETFFGTMPQALQQVNLAKVIPIREAVQTGYYHKAHLQERKLRGLQVDLDAVEAKIAGLSGKRQRLETASAQLSLGIERRNNRLEHAKDPQRAAELQVTLGCLERELVTALGRLSQLGEGLELLEKTATQLFLALAGLKAAWIQENWPRYFGSHCGFVQADDGVSCLVAAAVPVFSKGEVAVERNGKGYLVHSRAWGSFAVTVAPIADHFECGLIEFHTNLRGILSGSWGEAMVYLAMDLFEAMRSAGLVGKRGRRGGHRRS
jgi:hypothetical protein